MIACYDLARCPPTYDVVAFLALAEQERLRLGEDHIDVRILPGPAGGFRADCLWPYTVNGRVQMRDRVLVPLCWLLPSVRSVEVLTGGFTDPYVGEWGVGGYHIGLNNIMKALRADMRPLRSVPVPVTGILKFVTFTLREAEHWPLRNSRVSEWSRAAKILRSNGYRVMIIRDTVRANDHPWIWSDCSPNASVDIKCRSTLYTRAALNVGICNGPMWMSIFMDAPTLMLRPTTNEAGGCYDDAFYAQNGLPRGSQLPNSPSHQRLVWEDDTCENIVRAVEEMLADV